MVLVNEYRRIDRHSKSGVIGSNLLKLSEIQIWIVGPPHRPAFSSAQSALGGAASDPG
jgi:hypothetical protein